MLGIVAELMRTTTEARTIAEFPFFDEQLLTELSAALFGQALDLDPTQAENLDSLVRSLFDNGGGFDPGSASPLERYAVRAAMVSDLLGGLGHILYDSQREKWALLRDFAQEVMLGRVGANDYGIGGEGVENLILQRWRKAYSLDASAAEVHRVTAHDYLMRARAVLARYGSSDAELKRLEPQSAEQLRQELFDLQKAVETQILSTLGAEQWEAARASVPVLVRFHYGEGSTLSTPSKMAAF